MGAALAFRMPGSTLTVGARAALESSDRITDLIAEGVVLSTNRIPIAFGARMIDSHLKYRSFGLTLKSRQISTPMEGASIYTGHRRDAQTHTVR